MREGVQEEAKLVDIVFGFQGLTRSLASSVLDRLFRHSRFTSRTYDGFLRRQLVWKDAEPS